MNSLEIETTELDNQRSSRPRRQSYHEQKRRVLSPRRRGHTPKHGGKLSHAKGGKRSSFSPLRTIRRRKEKPGDDGLKWQDTCLTHAFCAHSTEPHVVACINCGKEAFENNSDSDETKLVKYLSSRRKRRILDNLWSLLVPIHPVSAHLTRQVLATIGVVSNTGCMHLTLLEGVPQNKCFDLDSTISALWRGPTMTVEAIKILPTIDESRKLVVANTRLSSSELRITLSASQTRLPQWPLHVALGTVATGSATEAQQALELQLLGKALSMLPEQVKWFPPTQRQTRTQAKIK